MIYQFVTPSDPVTFKAKRPEIAFAAALRLGHGKAAATAENGDNVPCMFIFSLTSDIDRTIKEQCGGLPLCDFERLNAAELAECFESFAYGTIESRPAYDAVIDAISDPIALVFAKLEHEDRDRTSMNRWVKTAWDTGTAFRKMAESSPVEFIMVRGDHPIASRPDQRFEPDQAAEAVKYADELARQLFDNISITLYPIKP